MKKGNITISSIFKGSKAIDKIVKGTLVVYEAWRELTKSGVPPITLQKCKGVDLVDYKIYGDIVQGLIPFDESKIASNLYPASNSFASGTKWKGYTFEAKPNTTYTLNKIEGETNLMVSSTEYPAVGVAYNIRTPNTQTSSSSITTGENDNYVTAYFYRDGTDTVDYETVLASIKIVEIPTPDTPIEIESVGDKTKNLLPYPYRSTTNVIEGVSWVDNGDGSISVSGTASAYSMFRLSYFSIKLKAGKKYYFKSQGTSSNIFLVFAYLDENGTRKYDGNGKVWSDGYSSPDLYLQVNTNQTASGKIYPYFVEESYKDDDYEPYGYKIPVIVRGENYILPNDKGTQTISGINIESDGKGNYHLYGTATALVSYRLRANGGLVIPAGKYRMTGVEKGDILTSYFWRISTDLINSDQAGKETIITYDTDNTIAYVMIYVRAGVTIDAIIKPRLELYDKEPITTNIYLNEPLRKLGDYVDYIDFEKGKVFRQVGEEIYDENTSYSLITSTYFYEEGVTTAFGCKIPTDGLPNAMGMECITNLLEYKKSTVLDKKVPYISGNTSQIVFALKNETASNIDELKTFLADNNLQIVYPLKEETPEIVTLPNIPTHKGTTIIEVDTNILPSNMEVKYYGKE